MSKKFNPKDIEKKWYSEWEKKGYFSPNNKKNTYSIMIPPPNVTGSLHMGHAFQNSIMDTLIRHQRMKGKNTLWHVGTDHAGIATQMVVERKIQQEQQKNRHDLGRKEFVEQIWQWKNESGNLITEQLRRLGASVDWLNESFTMDESFNNAVQEVFIRLYEDQLLYRGKRLVNWDPKLHTAISDLEVENHEKPGNMWYLRYPLSNNAKTKEGNDYIVIATTRPETLLGDSGIAVNPNDERYRHLIGAHAIVPIINRLIPIVADTHADISKGSGCVKITPAHDFNDYEVGKRYQLPLIQIFDKSACIKKNVDIFDYQGNPILDIDQTIPKNYHSLDRFVARKKIIEELKNNNYLEKVENHTLMIPSGDRSNVVIEPMLTDQWFVRSKPLAEPAINAVKQGDIKFVPKQYENMFFSWMNDIQDWCISRQLWWGHRIPAWYDNEGNVYVGRNRQEINQKYQINDQKKLYQDEDVLDTWFSSALWTFATLGWPDNNEKLQIFHPTSVLVTGFDIIFFWVARMMMLAMHFVKDKNKKPEIPFKKVYVTGLIRDENGQKMSKSKGNVIDPIDMIDGIDLESLIKKRCSNLMQPKLAEKIEKQTRAAFPKGINPYGTDALRFTLYSLASNAGRDINWDMKRLEGYRNFCNKIWNAAIYVQGHAKQINNNKTIASKLTLVDRWIQSRFQTLINQVEKNLQAFRLDHATQNIYDFIWNEYCAWYLELSKPILWGAQFSENEKQGTRLTMISIFEQTMRLIHPFMPFISEEIWQDIKHFLDINEPTIMLSKYPAFDNSKINQQAESEIQWIKSIVTSIRNIRAKLNIPPSKEIKVLLRNIENEEYNKLNKNKLFLKILGKVDEITLIDNFQTIPDSYSVLVGKMEILVQTHDLVDIQVEKTRLENEINKAKKEIDRINSQLNNQKFINNAPEHIIDEKKHKLFHYQHYLDNVLRKLESFNK